MESPVGSSSGALEDFSLREASRLYAVELTTLQRLVRRGGLDAFKSRGPWGREWRVTRAALEREGFSPRPLGEAVAASDEHVARLERELAAARRAAAAERSRAEEADRRLGEVLMESGRLRAALAVAEGDVGKDDAFIVDLDQLRGAVLDVRTGRGPAPGD